MADNPFEERRGKAELDTDDNPFYSSQNSTKPPVRQPAPALKEVRKSPSPAEVTEETKKPEPVDTESELVCPPNASPEVKAAFDALKKREAALMKWEANLKKREALLPKPPNCPSFYPLCYHNIDEQIKDPSGNTLMHQMYYLWYLTLTCWLVSWIAVVAVLSSGAAPSTAGWDFAMGTVWLLFGPFISWWMWYGRLYRLAKIDLPTGYTWFYILYTVQIVLLGVFMLGIPYIGGAGIITMMKMFNEKYDTEGYMCLFSTALFAIDFGAMIYMYYKVLHFQSTRTLNTQRAKEFLKQATASV